MTIRTDDGYEFRTSPYSHQLEKFLARRDETAWGHLWEQGTGKTKEDIDQTAYAFERGDLDAVLIVAPNGVHENWITDEIPTHLPERVLERTKLFAYHALKASTLQHIRACEEVLAHDGPVIVAMSYDAIMTGKVTYTEKGQRKKWLGGKLFAEKLLDSRKAKMTLDESSRIKSAGAKRTRKIVTIGRRAERRRIYSGTPVPNGPFDIYPQIKFLDEDFWKRHGFQDYSAFKAHFGVWKTEVNSQTGGRFEFCVAYRNLDDLYEIIAEITDRVTKDDVLDLPPKIYTPRRFELTHTQRKLYNELRDECIAWLDDEQAVTAAMPIVKMLRLQQIACGYVPRSEEDIQAGDEEPIFEIPGGNPRLDILGEIVQDLPHPAIVWARFRRDVDNIVEMLDRLKLTYVRYDGAIPPGPERAAAKKRFNDGEVQFFVANPAVGGQGLTLVRAKTTIYYSNSFDLDHRLQSEDRNHRIGQEDKVNYIDLIARSTIDGQIVRSLRQKIDVAARITGDELREWL